MQALASKAQHVPYRNSKLTHVLLVISAGSLTHHLTPAQDAIGGRSKALMFVMVPPAENQQVEANSALRFAERCKAVLLGGAKKMEAENAELKTLVANLRSKTAEAQTTMAEKSSVARLLFDETASAYRRLAAAFGQIDFGSSLDASDMSVSKIEMGIEVRRRALGVWLSSVENGIIPQQDSDKRVPKLAIGGVRRVEKGKVVRLCAAAETAQSCGSQRTSPTGW